MKVIVCGGGQVGKNIVEYLSSEGSYVTLIEKDEKLLDSLTAKMDIRGVWGFASDPKVMKQAGADDADMIIAVTRDDEVNMVCCQVAHTLFNIPMKIARIRNQSFLDPIWGDLYSRDHLPIDVIISPELEVAQYISRRLSVLGAYDMVPLLNDKVIVNSVVCEENCPVATTPIRFITQTFPNLQFQILFMVRDGKEFLPGVDEQIRHGDEVYFVAKLDQIHRVLSIFGHELSPPKKIAIFGGGNVGFFLAKEILENHPKVALDIVESNPVRAEEIASKLKKTGVICGDVLDPAILAEANVKKADIVVSVTNDDEVNILASLMVKQLGVKSVMSLVTKPNYSKLLTNLGIDAAVNPRAVTVSKVLNHLRKGKLHGVHSLRDGYAELFEASVLEGSVFSKSTIKELKLPKGIIVGAILRGDEIMFAYQNPLIQPRDILIILAQKDRVKQVEAMFLNRKSILV